MIAAAAANLAIALVKALAGFYTGSAALLTEALHSLVDTADEGLLLLGLRGSRRPPDARHPFGYGMELYFWAFIVALVVFVAGGVASIVEGVLKIMHPEPLHRVWLGFAVLGAAFIFESISLSVGLRGLKRKGGSRSLLSTIITSKDPSVFSTVLEDAAALVGLAIAACGLAAAAWAGWPWADGAASVAIGCVLISVALFLGRETRSLLTGEAAAEGVRHALWSAAEQGKDPIRVDEVLTLQLGADHVMAAFRLRLAAGPDDPTARRLRALAAAARRADPRIRRIFFTLHESAPSRGGAAGDRPQTPWGPTGAPSDGVDPAAARESGAPASPDGYARALAALGREGPQSAVR